MMKRSLLAMTLMTVLTLMPAFAWAQKGGGSGGSGMMGGQQGSMMQGSRASTCRLFSTDEHPLGLGGGVEACLAGEFDLFKAGVFYQFQEILSR